MQLDLNRLREIIAFALAEDIGEGDITTNLTITDHATVRADFISRENCVIAGIPVLEEIFLAAEGKVTFEPKASEGMEAKKGDCIFTVSGDAKTILAYERVSLNLLQYMCGIATETRKYARAVAHTKAKILDTRKTLPGLRALSKYAVWIGGGKNHRFGLYDGILIKDNHIAIAGGDIIKTIQSAKLNAPQNMKVEVECDTLEQVKAALQADADIILLDNMNLETLKKAVEMNKGKALLEASGGVSLNTVKAIAETGVDYISVGALTHSVKAIDIGLDFI